MNKRNESYKLNSIFEKFKDFTGYKDNYSASGFARKVQIAFNKYNLGDFISIIKQKDPMNPAHHKQAYFFTEEEKNIVSLFMCSSAPKYGKSKKDFNEEKLNPFSWKSNGCNSTLSELQCYMEHLLNYINDNQKELCVERTLPFSYGSKPYYINKIELENINYKIQLSVRLKEILERIITVLYYQDEFDSVIFEYMLTRLEGFADELDIISSTTKGKYHKQRPTYNSADVSIAASLGDALAYSNYLKQNKSKGDKKFLNNHYKNYLFEKNNKDKIAKPKHSLLTSFDISLQKPHLSKDYMHYIDKTIEGMVKDFVKLYNDINTTDETKEKYYKYYGICHDQQNPTYYRLESILFRNYVYHKVEEASEAGNYDFKEIATKIKDEIHEILKKSKEKTKEIILEDTYQIASTLDVLLFKPFIRFHDLDVKELKERVNNNPIY